MQAEAAGQRLQAFGAVGEFGEDFHLDGAEKSFGGPEGEAGLQDVIGADCGRADFGCDWGRSHGVPLVRSWSPLIAADRGVRRACGRRQ